MKAFTFDPSEHRDTFAEQGWVHVREGVSAPLLDELRAMLARSRAADPLKGSALKGEKVQHLFETADLDGFCAQLFDMVSAMCGTRRERMTLSERHLKVYDADADPDPPAHKDRFASLISVGLSIEVPSDSRLLLYPHVHREVNRFLTTAHRASLGPDELPEVVLRDEEPVEIADGPGDVVVFYGSSIWHLRRRSANAALLYLKCNDFDSDPLGEDPSTPARRARTLELVGAADRATLDGLVPVPARRLQSVTVEYGRDWDDDIRLTVFDERPVPISSHELALLRAVDGTRTVAELAGGDGEAARAVLRLAELEAVDLLDRPYESRAATASAMADVDAAAGSSRDALRS